MEVKQRSGETQQKEKVKKAREKGATSYYQKWVLPIVALFLCREGEGRTFWADPQKLKSFRDKSPLS